MVRSIKEILRSYAVLDAEGRHINGTDKQSNHNYGDVYECIISNAFSIGPAEPRNIVRLMMEVGVADGSCLLAWREIFPNATIVGMDIHPSARAHGDRIEFRLGNQHSKLDCESAAAGRQFDMIVEDATHVLEASLLTLLYLWPFVKPGGLYVVEEWDNIGALRQNVLELWRDKSGCGEGVRAEVIDTLGPFGGVEPLVVFRKPL